MAYANTKYGNNNNFNRKRKYTEESGDGNYLGHLYSETLS